MKENNDGKRYDYSTLRQLAIHSNNPEMLDFFKNDYLLQPDYPNSYMSDEIEQIISGGSDRILKQKLRDEYLSWGLLQKVLTAAVEKEDNKLCDVLISAGVPVKHEQLARALKSNNDELVRTLSKGRYVDDDNCFKVSAENNRLQFLHSLGFKSI